MDLRWLGIVGAGLVLAVVLALAVGDATMGDDWPGWDEGWVLVAFPVGVPAAVAAGLAAGGRRVAARAVVAVTAGVWLWGAVLFVVWLGALH